MKKSFRNLVLTLGLGVACIASQASSGNDMAWDKAPNTTNDMATLQNGAKLFVNYCLNCHSAEYMRYNRLQDIGLTEAQIKTNLMFSTEKVGETMKVAADPKQSKEWFGANPPDLTLVARSRAGHGGTGADYLYTYLRSYYRDNEKATGWNNLVYPNVAMPNVLWELQGERKPIYTEVKGFDKDGKPTTAHVFNGKWEQTKAGTLTPQQYDAAVADLVNYLDWMSDPGKNNSKRTGVFVLLYLMCFSFIAWRLNAAYWKDVK